MTANEQFQTFFFFSSFYICYFFCFVNNERTGYRNIKRFSYCVNDEQKWFELKTEAYTHTRRVLHAPKGGERAREVKPFMCVTTNVCSRSISGKIYIQHHGKRFQQTARYVEVTMESDLHFGFGSLSAGCFSFSFFSISGLFIQTQTLYKTLFRQFYAVLRSRNL